MEENNINYTNIALTSLQAILTKVAGCCMITEEDDPLYFAQMASTASNLAITISHLENKQDATVLENLLLNNYEDDCDGNCEQCEYEDECDL